LNKKNSGEKVLRKLKNILKEVRFIPDKMKRHENLRHKAEKLNQEVSQITLSKGHTDASHA
jgi:hypothetical protein